MSEATPPEENLTEEFRNLGKNLADALRTAWEHPERVRLQEEISEGLNEMGHALKSEVEAAAESPTGQQLKSDVHRIGERIRSPETHERVRHELITVLQAANAELQKVIQQLSEAQSQQPPGEEPGEPPAEKPAEPREAGA